MINQIKKLKYFKMIKRPIMETVQCIAFLVELRKCTLTIDITRWSD